MRLRGLGLGRVGMKKLKNSHKGRVVRISHKGRVLCEFLTRKGCCANFAQGNGVVRISHNALFTRANAKLWCFQMATILGF